MSLLQVAEQHRLLDLVEPNSRDFAFPGWPTELSRQRCFRVIGLQYVLDYYEIPHAAIFGNSGYARDAIESIPANWKNDYPASDWDAFKKDQFSWAYRSLPTRMNKACIAIMMSCAALEARGLPYDKVLTYVKICPQTFFIDGFDRNFYERYVVYKPLQDSIIKESGQESSSIIHQISQGWTVSWLTATKIQKVLENAHPHLRVRHSLKRPRHIVMDEIVVYDPTLYDLPPLTRGAGPGSAKRA